MNIYLIIIIGYILLRVARLFFKSQRLSKILEQKRVRINGNLFVIKKLTALDFPEKGLPFSYFDIGTGLDAANQLRKKPDSDKITDEEYKRIIETAKIMIDKAVVYSREGVNSKTMFDSGKDKAVSIGLVLYQKIIEHNFLMVNKIHKLDKGQVLHVGELCNTFGIAPHKHISNPKRLSSLEKYMIDDFFYNTWLDRQNEIIKSQEAG